MLDIGTYQKLQILRKTSVGLFLGNEAGDEVLLPNKYCPEEYEIDAYIKVFIYRDNEQRLIATTIEPLITLNQFACLKVKDISKFGAFLDWGLEKDLLVPKREQSTEMEEGQWYVVYLYVDDLTDRLAASSRIKRHLNNNEEIDVEVGEKVDLIAFASTDLGIKVIVNHEYEGLIYHDADFRKTRFGDTFTGYISNIRPDKKLDVTLRPQGYENMDIVSQELLQTIEEHGGYLDLHDKSDPELIRKRLGMSKKLFKKALGSLYKARFITLEKEGVRLVE